MRVSDINELVFEGDAVIDRMDNSRRVIAGFVVHDENDAEVQLEDGGVMALSEIAFDDIRLESELDASDQGVEDHEAGMDDEDYRREAQAHYDEVGRWQ